MNSTLGWGIIGAGNVCEHKGGPPLYRVAGSRLVGVTRRNADRGRDFARRHGPCRYYPLLTELLAQPSIHAIYVASPPALHCEHTLAAARAGKHVLVEKPMASNAAECETMIAVCRQHNVTLAVAYYRRCYPTIMRLKQLLADGAVGRPQMIRLNSEFPLSHRLDLVHFFFGDIAQVRVCRRETGFELRAVTVTGVEAILSVGWKETGRPEQVEVTGHGGRVVVDDLKGGSLTVNGRREVFPPLPATHWGLVENFVRHLAGQAPLACDGVEGRKSTVILDIVSTLTGEQTQVTVDYGNPPPYDPVQAARLGLLG